MQKIWLTPILLILILTPYVYLAYLDLSKPWTEGHSGFNGALISTIAYHYDKFGYLDSKLGQTTNKGWSGETGKEEYGYYLHHPVGMPLLISLGFKLFGLHESVSRSINLFLIILIALFFFLLVKELYNKWLALGALLFLVYTPVFISYRHFVAYEILALFFITSILYYYVKWIKNIKNRKYFTLLLIFSALGTLSDWSVYFVFLPILMHYFFFIRPEIKSKKDRYKFLFLPLIVIIMFSLFFVHLFVLSGKFFGPENNIIEQLKFRMSISPASKPYNITFPRLINLIRDSFLRYLTPLMFILTLLGIFLTFIVTYNKEKDYKNNTLIFLVFLFYIIHIFALRNQFWIHPFMYIINLSLFSVLFSVLGIKVIHEKILKNFKFNKYHIITLVLFLFLSSLFLIKSYTFYKKEGTETVDPLVDFLSENKEDAIITFGVHPDAHALKYYLMQRKVKDIREKSDFDNTNKNNFTHLIILKDNPINKDFYDYLIKNYKYVDFGRSIVVSLK